MKKFVLFGIIFLVFIIVWEYVTFQLTWIHYLPEYYFQKAGYVSYWGVDIQKDIYKSADDGYLCEVFHHRSAQDSNFIVLVKKNGKNYALYSVQGGYLYSKLITDDKITLGSKKTNKEFVEDPFMFEIDYKYLIKDLKGL